MKACLFLALAGGVLISAPASAQYLQANVAVQVPHDAGASASFGPQPLMGGIATVAGVVRNQVDGQVTEIDVVFDYRSPDPIIFDEIIEHIEFDTEEIAGGKPFGTAVIHPNYVNLNPNRASLSYRVSLYYPQALEGFVARVKVYGNYE